MIFPMSVLNYRAVSQKGSCTRIFELSSPFVAHSDETLGGGVAISPPPPPLSSSCALEMDTKQCDKGAVTSLLDPLGSCASTHVH